MASRVADIGVIGGGIVGLAVARQLQADRPGAEVLVLEKDLAVGQQQTSHNSGVVHAGLYYAPGSLKARLCRRGAEMLRDYCTERGLPYQRLGKLVVARDQSEEERLRVIEGRARQNAVPDLTWLDRGHLQEVEPHVVGRAALHSPHTGATDFLKIAEAYAGDVRRSGGDVLLGRRATSIRQKPGTVEVKAGSETFRFNSLVVCGGLQSDLLAKAAGRGREPAIVPFRGEYYDLAPSRTHLVRGMIYPVPDPALPFLGVHLTRHVDGTVSVGPNAVLALAREGYTWRDVSPRDLASTFAWPGFWRMARTYWRTGAAEMRMSLGRATYLGEARTFVPELTSGDLQPGKSGVRAQALDRRGRLVDDFVIEREDAVTLVRNAPSPAATSSLAIAEHVVQVHTSTSR